jgi:SulP family sulfate permease
VAPSGPADHSHYRSVPIHAEAVPPHGIIVHRFNADLIFSNSAAFVTSVMEMADEADPLAYAVVVDCEQLADMDITGADPLEMLNADLQSIGLDTRLA